MSSFPEHPEISREYYSVGDLIFSEGDLGCHLYIIEKGKVEIFKKAKDGSRLKISTMQPGESFGEFALLDRRPRSASARAMSDTVVVKLSEEGYEFLLEELPSWAISMMKSFILRLRNMNSLLAEKDQFPPR